MQRLYARKLVDYRSFDPQHAEALEPDLAIGLGDSSANFTRFGYHLKQGIKFEDGSEITSEDVKYALKRIYATDVISGGPTRLLPLPSRHLRGGHPHLSWPVC